MCLPIAALPPALAEAGAWELPGSGRFFLKADTPGLGGRTIQAVATVPYEPGDLTPVTRE